MSSTSSLLLPPADLSASVFGAIVRDTRGARLSDADRLNFFPASPLVCLTHVIEGELHLAPFGQEVEAFRQAPRSPAVFVTEPQDMPTASWSPGPIFAISVGFYPDAWKRLDQSDAVEAVIGTVFARDSSVQAGWERFCSALEAVIGGDADGGRPARLAEWVRAMLVRAALSGSGRSARSIERRVRQWTGQSRRTLEFFASFEHLHRISRQSSSGSLADMALEAGYSDQSHMGRTVRRGTGFSPARLNQMIATEEAFWCYRLLGERF